MARALYWIAAWISLALGVLGVLLPLMPGIPLLLLAIFLFYRGSAQNAKNTRQAVSEWRENRSVDRGFKWLLTLILLGLAAYALIVLVVVWLKPLMVVLLLGGLIYLWTRPDSGSQPQGRPR